ncbi:hypothetical protein ACW9HR_32780 [Nocardia gipuzkoensis]
MITGFAPEAFRVQEMALYFFSVGIETSMSANFARFYDPGHGFAYSGITGTVSVRAGLIVAASAPRVSELPAGVHRRAAWVQNTKHSSTI